LAAFFFELLAAAFLGALFLAALAALRAGLAAFFAAFLGAGLAFLAAAFLRAAAFAPPDDIARAPPDARPTGSLSGASRSTSPSSPPTAIALRRRRLAGQFVVGDSHSAVEFVLHGAPFGSEEYLRAPSLVYAPTLSQAGRLPAV
jgi:hypothetical protein